MSYRRNIELSTKKVELLNSFLTHANGQSQGTILSDTDEKDKVLTGMKLADYYGAFPNNRISNSNVIRRKILEEQILT
jgi:hypothetical protein